MTWPDLYMCVYVYVRVCVRACVSQVLQDVETTLGPVPTEQQTAYQAVCEIYGSTRMFLACLDRPLLDKVS